MRAMMLHLNARRIGLGSAGKSRGFSALEVLIAAAITVVGILAIASMFPSSYTNVSKSGKQTAAVHLAQQRLEALRNQGYANITAADNETGVAIAGYTGYTRSTTIADPAPGPIANMKQITVRVTPPSGAFVEVRSLIAQ